MKKLTISILTLALGFQSAASWAQIDATKMERDLRVASSVLASLMNNDKDHLFRGGEPEANYVEGYGVIFTIEDDMIFRYNYMVQDKATREAQIAVREVQRVQREVKRAKRQIAHASREGEHLKNEKAKKNEKDKSNYTDEIDVVVDIDPIQPISDIELNIGIYEDELREKSEEANEEFAQNLREAFELFLIDYSQLIGQLKPTDKILLSTKNNSSYNFVFAREDGEHRKRVEKSRLSAELLLKDHKDYQSGKLNRDQLVNKIKFVENAEMERKPDLDLFGNMLKTTYDVNYTETYFISSLPKYELLAGLGVVYSIKVYSSYSEDGLFRMPGNKQSGLSKEERDRAVELMYSSFIEGFKENMIRYGSTVKSLNEGDKLIVKAKMTTCETCSFPSAIEFMVDKATLSQFSKGALTLDKAKNKVNLK